MSLTERAYEIAEDAFIRNEDFIMQRISEFWPDEYERGKQAVLEHDPDAAEDLVPNLSFVCEEVAEPLHEKFLKDLQRICDSLIS